MTGDFHVPMGACTFVAVLEPAPEEGRGAAYFTSHRPPPPLDLPVE